MALNDALSWYQKKVGAFDKQLWERSVESRILRGLNNLPRKNAKLKTELIDVDLVRGSAFPKAKPEHGLLGATIKGFMRTIFLPFFHKWWIQQTSGPLFLFILILYILQAGLVSIYFLHRCEFIEIQQAEVLIPVFVMTILGILNSQIVSTHHYIKSTSKIKRVAKKKKIRRKFRPKSCQKNFEESKSSPETASEERLNATKLWNDTHEKVAKGVYSGSEILSSTDNEDTLPSVVKELDVHLAGSDVNNLQRVESGYSSPDRTSLDDSVQRANKTQSKDGGDVCAAKQEIAVELDESKMNVETCELKSDKKDDQNSDSVRKKSNLKSRSVQMSLGNATDTHIFSCNNAVNRVTSSCDSDLDNLTLSTNKFQSNLSDIDWVTSNADCNSATSDSSSGMTNSDVSDPEESQLDDCDNPFAWDGPEAPSVNIMSTNQGAGSDKVSCTIWENNDCKKVDLTVLDISSSIIRKVDMTPESTEYFKASIFFCLILCIIPCIHRLTESNMKLSQLSLGIETLTIPSSDMLTECLRRIMDKSFGSTTPKRLLIICLIIQRLALSGLIFFLLAVAERTFKQRYLYAKHFSHLTSSRRARKSELPHFRLNKVRNIKTWLSVRSYLKKRGPQRSVDVIVSSAFLFTVSSALFICVQLLKNGEIFANLLYNWELGAWTLCLAVFLLRFMTLGSKINHKFKNLSVLITEQINLYLHMEQKPHKKEELMLAHNVLKLAAELLKELESPFKISGISANSYLHNVTKIVVLSAFSAVLTEVLGFRLKLSKLALFKF